MITILLTTLTENFQQSLTAPVVNGLLIINGVKCRKKNRNQKEILNGLESNIKVTTVYSQHLRL